MGGSLSGGADTGSWVVSQTARELFTIYSCLDAATVVVTLVLLWGRYRRMAVRYTVLLPVLAPITLVGWACWLGLMIVTAVPRLVREALS